MEAITVNVEYDYGKRQGKIAQDALKLLEQRFDFGKRLYKDRSELHSR